MLSNETLKQFENIDFDIVKDYTKLSNKAKKNFYIKKGNKFVPIHSELEPEAGEL